jgi:hypothetical protein
MTETTLSRIARGAFRRDPRLLAAMHDLVRPSYEGTPAVLDYEVSICDTLYLLSDEAGLICFFLTGTAELRVAGTLVPAVYMGLSATREGTKGSGHIRQLFEALANDVSEREAVLSARVLLFGTFATPSSLYGIELLFSDVAPHRDGTYRDEYLPALPAIHTFLESHADPACPFRLPGHATGTRYSVAERARIADICRRKDFKLFDLLDVDESRGDRLVLCARGRRRLETRR